MFPNSWPGKGLLLLRLVAGGLLIHDGVSGFSNGAANDAIARQVAEACAGGFLLVGLWTPLAGALVLIVELWIIYSGTDHLSNSIVLATLGPALAMLGPGALSVDAVLYGRKRIDLQSR